MPTTHLLVPHATLVVPADEGEAYQAAGLEPIPQMPLVTIPPDRIGMSQVRNWIVRQFPEEVVVMYDDDVTACRTLASLLNRNLSPAETAAMVENVAWSAKGTGARLFGWNQRPDPRVLQRNNPFSVVHWCGGVLGVVGKEVRWDEMLRFKCDFDCCLGELLRNRIIWHESRFCFLQAHLRLDTYQSHDRVQVVVERRQRVDRGGTQGAQGSDGVASARPLNPPIAVSINL